MGLPHQKQMSEFVEALRLNMDTDQDGEGSSAVQEFASAIMSLGQNPNEEELGEFLNQITRKFKVPHMQEMDSEEELKEVFKVFDRDQNGYISATELRNVMMSLGEKLTEEEAEQMIKEADLDGDGSVNYEDFVKLMKRI